MQTTARGALAVLRGAGYIDADHMSFSDWNLITKVNETDKINPQEAVSLTRNLLVNFFDKYLKCKPLSVFADIPPKKETEIKYRLK